MSTSPDTRLSADDRLVGVISQWLARHVSDEELRKAVEDVGTNDLSPEQAEAVGELRKALTDGIAGGELEMVARETLEAVALGG